LHSRVGQAVLHERAPVAFALAGTVRPEAVHVQVVVAQHGNPRRFKRRVLDENRVFHLQLSEHMAFAQPIGEPLALRLDAGMGLPDANDAGKMLVGKVLGG